MKTYNALHILASALQWGLTTKTSSPLRPVEENSGQLITELKFDRKLLTVTKKKWHCVARTSDQLTIKIEYGTESRSQSCKMKKKTICYRKQFVESCEQVDTENIKCYKIFNCALCIIFGCLSLAFFYVCSFVCSTAAVIRSFSCLKQRRQIYMLLKYTGVYAILISQLFSYY